MKIPWREQPLFLRVIDVLMWGTLIAAGIYAGYKLAGY